MASLDPGGLPIGRPHRVGVARSANRVVDRCLADFGIEGRVSERRPDELRYDSESEQMLGPHICESVALVLGHHVPKGRHHEYRGHCQEKNGEWEKSCGHGETGIRHPIAQRRAISALLIVSLYPSPSHAASSL